MSNQIVVRRTRRTWAVIDTATETVLEGGFFSVGAAEICAQGVRDRRAAITHLVPVQAGGDVARSAKPLCNARDFGQVTTDRTHADCIDCLTVAMAASATEQETTADTGGR